MKLQQSKRNSVASLVRWQTLHRLRSGGQSKGLLHRLGRLLEDVQLGLHDAISGETILKTYTDETRQQFAAVIKEIIEDTLVRALTLSQQRMDEWMKGTLDNSIRDAQKSLASVTTDFRVKLGGAWWQLLWGCIRGGILAGVLLLVGGFWLGRHW